MLLWAGLVVLLASWLPASPAGAANSPTFRDCSFVLGIDPDFVQLSGAATGPGGALAVSSAQSSVAVEASESSDPFDNLGHVTLSVTVTGPGATPTTVSGGALDHVILSVPLSGVAAGGAYTLNWSATFDNGIHMCPSTGTPQNMSPIPFVLGVVPSSQLPNPPTSLPSTLGIANIRQSHRTWRVPGSHPKTKSARRAPVGTQFSFDLTQSVGVKLAFSQMLPGRRRSGRCVKASVHARGRRCTRSVPRGSFSVAGTAGTNTVPFNARTRGLPRLSAGNYVLVVRATNGAGQSVTQSIRFTIVG
jgi:hypothetical protein